MPNFIFLQFDYYFGIKFGGKIFFIVYKNNRMVFRKHQTI